MNQSIEDGTRSRPFRLMIVIMSVGEATVTLRGKDRVGGIRNSCWRRLWRQRRFLFPAIAADTDGSFGSEDNSGAFADGGSMARLRSFGMDRGSMLSRNDAYSAFEALGDLVEPGPIGTNVNDFRTILIRQPGAGVQR